MNEYAEGRVDRRIGDVCAVLSYTVLSYAVLSYAAQSEFSMTSTKSGRT